MGKDTNNLLIWKKFFQARYKKFFDPKILKKRLILISIYIAAFEILKDSIVKQIQGFYVALPESHPESLEEEILSRYKDEVLSKHKSPVYASLEWLKESQAITDDDIEKFNRIKKCRNLLAHETVEIAIEGFSSDFEERFDDMIELLEKIENWWIINVDIPSNSDFDGKEINESDVASGKVMILKTMIDISLNDIGGFSKND